MRRRTLIGCLVPIVLLVAAAIGWLAWASQTITLRYRLTLFVDDNGKTVTGSSVINTQWGGLGQDSDELAPLFGGKRWWPLVTGEAVTVDLGARGDLFLIFADDPARGQEHNRAGSIGSPAALVVATFSGVGPGGASWDMLRQIRDTRKTVDVPIRMLPWLVRFRNLNDPATVEPVDPENLDASFGPGVKFLRATIEMTNDPVTTGIEKRLPWLALPTDEQAKLWKGPYWDYRDPGYSSTSGLLPDYFKITEGIL
jgi:hypothetical protein